MSAQSLQLCLTLCDPMNCSPPDSTVRGILQTKILEWIAMPPPGDLPDPGMEAMSLASAGRFFTSSATWEAHKGSYLPPNFKALWHEHLYFLTKLGFCSCILTCAWQPTFLNQ